MKLSLRPRLSIMLLGAGALIFLSGFSFYVPTLGTVPPPAGPAYLRHAVIFSRAEYQLATREVITPNAIEPNQIALTFDDGPSPRTTRKILDILKHYQVPATFFVIGMHAAMDPQLVREMSAAGCEVGSHTYYHTDLATTDAGLIRRELLDTQATIKKILGSPPFIFRPPGGRYNELTKKIARENHLAMVLWDINPADFVNLAEQTEPSGEETYRMVVGKIASSRRGRIILLHENMQGTLDALPKIIQYAQAHHFKLVTVSQLRYKNINPIE